MTIGHHATTFAGRRVVNVPPDGPLPTVDEPVTWRFSVWHFDDDDSQGGLSEPFRDAFEAFVDQHGATVESLVIGAWGYAAFHPAPLAQLAAAAPRLPRLRALFLGDMISEECEVSWMKVGDVAEVLDAFPDLTEFRVRGGEDFTFHPVKHANLGKLAVESGGLPLDFVSAVLASDLPALTDLELWLGTDEYGGDTSVDDLAPLLAGDLFPTLRHLGLRNSEIADAIAGALATAPIVARLETLDLSLGTLGDEGADALLAGRSLAHLTKLDLHHHFLTDEGIDRFRQAYPDADLTEQEDPDQYDDEDEIYRFTAVSE